MIKTNKSYTKRLRITKNGKLMARKPGQDHFNAKDAGKKTMAKHRQTPFVLKNKEWTRFLPGK